MKNEGAMEAKDRRKEGGGDKKRENVDMIKELSSVEKKYER